MGVNIVKLRARTSIILAITAIMSTTALAQQSNAIKSPAEKQIGTASKVQMEPSLVVLNSDGATLADGKLTLTGVAATAIMFADRPVRAAGHVTTTSVVDEWNADETFAKDPPNATVSVFTKDGKDVKDAVVELTSPKMVGPDLIFNVKVLEGDLTGADGAAAVFIDAFYAAYRGPARYGAIGVHGAWYGAPAGGAIAGAAVAGAVTGAVVGAAAASRPVYVAPPAYYPPYPAPYPAPYPYYAPY
ncbi:hypothetical protein [Kaistia dalseonensis]|uniref:hypothetical protein n=1 Tax=Kaistia dalseonensis TaxID=410840 RepID=UPI00351F9BD9